MLRDTPARGPPVICLLDSSSEDEDGPPEGVRNCRTAAEGGEASDDECTVTAVVTAAERSAAARRAALVLDASPSPQSSPISSPTRTMRVDNTLNNDTSTTYDRPAEKTDVWAELALGAAALKCESSAMPGDKAQPGTPGISGDMGCTVDTSAADEPSSDSEDEDLYGPDPSSRAFVTEARKHADVAAWSEPDIEEFAQPMDAVRAACNELDIRKPGTSAASGEARRQIPRSSASADTTSSSDDEDVDPYSAAQASDPQAGLLDECPEGDFDIGADTIFDDELPQQVESGVVAPAEGMPDHGEDDEEDEEPAMLVDRRYHRRNRVLEDSSDDDEKGASPRAVNTRPPPRRSSLEDENAESDDVDLSASSEDEAGELAKELKDLQLYTTSIVTPNSKPFGAQVYSSAGRRSARLSARKQQMDGASRHTAVSSGEGSDEEPWDRSEADDSTSLEESSLDDFIVDTDEEDERLPGELGQLLTKLRGTNARGEYSDDDSDFSDEELEGEYYDPEEDGSFMSVGDTDDDEGSLRDFVVEEDGGESRRLGRPGRHSSEEELLHDLTNLSVSSGQPKARGDRRKPGRTTRKTESAGWSLGRVATAVRESGRALGPRSHVSIAVGEWSRHRKRLTMEIFEDLNSRAFAGKLPSTLEIVWSARLLTTAGRSINSWTQYGPRTRISKIELATKVIDDPVKLFNTLGHELAHAAVWVVSHSNEGHGRIWQGWMQRIHALYPGFDMSTRHGYAIHKPHRWQCNACNGLETRHSKSVKPTDACKRCGAPGRLEYLGKFTKTGSPVKTRDDRGSGSNKSNPYAEFTKKHMREISQSLPSGTPQKQVMVEVGRRWREHKAALEATGVGDSGSRDFVVGGTAGDAAFARQLQMQFDAGVVVD